LRLKGFSYPSLARRAQFRAIRVDEKHSKNRHRGELAEPSMEPLPQALERGARQSANAQEKSGPQLNGASTLGGGDLPGSEGLRLLLGFLRGRSKSYFGRHT
jgi:hypothetical protein